MVSNWVVEGTDTSHTSGIGFMVVIQLARVLTKLPVNRSRPLLYDMVGSFQSSFLPGRSTSDNILIT
ncbi:hypothetical protein SCA6_002251 [Theobroma cacao]